MTKTQKVNKIVMGHDASCPYNPIITNNSKITYNTLCIYYTFKYFLTFWEITIK